MSHDIVIFQNAVLGNVFGDFTKSRMPKTLDFTAFQILSQNKAKWESQKCFWENEKSFFGKIPIFRKLLLGKYCFKSGKSQQNTGGALMRKKGYKGRCEKKSLSKSKEVCRTYDPLQSKYADTLEESSDIQEIRCNVLLEGLAEGEYTSDFVCTKTGGDLMVRECLQRNRLTKPMNAKLLNASREYWTKTWCGRLGAGDQCRRINCISKMTLLFGYWKKETIRHL